MLVFFSKILLPFLVLMLFSLSLSGQIDTIQVVYFENGQISAIQVMENNRQGKAHAYNQQGKLIYERSIRRYAGSSSVRFTFHTNRVIQKADYYSQPDAGIQWWRTTSFFSEEGELIKEIKDGYDLELRVTVPHDTGPSIKDEIKRQMKMKED